MPDHDPFDARASLGPGLPDLYRLSVLGPLGLDLGRAPMTVKILLENALRHAGGGIVRPADVETLARWRPGAAAGERRRAAVHARPGHPPGLHRGPGGRRPRRHARRDGRPRAAIPARVNPLVPADLVIDHSVQVDRFGTPAAFAFNVEREYERNGERYGLLRWAQTAFRDLRVVPPGTGIVHQVNLEFLATVVASRPDAQGPVAFPDTLVGTDSHTTMINGLGVLGYGVGGIEAEAVLLGQPLYQPMPRVVGVRLHGELPQGSTATDLVLVVTELLRGFGVVGAFVEFAGDGLAGLSLADRATIANMSPEFGATSTLFPIDDETLDLPPPDRPAERSSWRSSSATRRPRACGASPVPDRTSTTGSSSTWRPSSRRWPDRAGRRTGSSSPGLRDDFRAAFPQTVAAHDGGDTAPDGRRGRSRPTDPRTRSRSRSAAGRATIRSGSVAIAAITSCTNTSNPTVMVGAGLLARNAVARGLSRRPDGQDVARPGLQGGHRLPRGGRPHGPRSSGSASPWPATAARPASATPGRSTSRSPGRSRSTTSSSPPSCRATATSRAGSTRSPGPATSPRRRSSSPSPWPAGSTST